jgi:hypothetical protein
MSHRDLGTALLELESALCKQGAVLVCDDTLPVNDARWNATRRRKWVQYVATAHTISQIICGWHALDSFIDWSAATAAWTVYDRRKCLQLVPTNDRNKVR